jgi:putative inorganic carbon (hco3(-)) transporter
VNATVETMRRPSWWNERTEQGLIDLGFGVFLFALPIPGTPSLQYIALALVLAVWLVRSVRQGRPQLTATPLAVPLLLWGFWIALSLSTSIHRSYSVSEFRSEYLTFTAVFFLFAAVRRSDAQMLLYLRVLLASLLSMVLYQAGVFLVGGWEYFPPSLYARAESFLRHYDRCASYLSFLVPIALALALSERGRWRWAAWAGVVGGVALQLITFSRAGWLALLVSFLLLGLTWRRWLLGVLLGGMVLTALLLPDTFRERALSLRSGDRVLVWTAGLRMTAEHPWLGIGYGNRNFSRLYPHYMPAGGIDGVLQNAHNIFIEMALETGLPGLVLFLAMLARALIAGLYRRLPQLPEARQALFWGPLAALTGFLTHSLFAFHFENEGSLLFMILLGMLLPLSSNYTETDI